MQVEKIQGKFGELCCLEFIFSQSEYPNYEHFLGSMPLNSLGHTSELNFSLEKSGKRQGKVREFHPFWRVDTLKQQIWLWKNIQLVPV